MTQFKILRAALGAGSLIMLLAGIALAVSPAATTERELKQGIDGLAESGQFKATAHKQVIPGMALLWGGAAGLALALLSPEPEPVGMGSAGAIASPKAPSPTPTAQPITGNSLSDFWAQGIGFSAIAQQIDIEQRRSHQQIRSRNNEFFGWGG